MDYTLIPIGIIHSPYKDKALTPIQSARSTTHGEVEVFPEYLEGLEGIEAFSHIYLIYGFHRSEKGFSLKVQPFLDDQLHGLFCTRYPQRPNPLGFSVVRLLERQGGLLRFSGADMLDGTPLWDIKPYIPEFDVFEVQNTGWYAIRKIT